MNPFFFLLQLVLLTACFFISCRPPVDEKATAEITSHPKGTLFIIGGGERDDTLMQQMIEVSGWEKGELITAISLPSEYDSAYHWINDQLQRMTGQACIRFDSAAVHDEKKLDSLSRSKIIFIGGGDQSRMMQLIAGTRVKEIIREAYQNGATVGGTSAGASILSEKMITGNQLLEPVYESTFSTLRGNNIELAQGLGLLDSVIIDQHFIARSRYNRLLSAVMEYPKFQCIGIDEATAIVVQGESAAVVGESSVIVIQEPHQVEERNNQLIGARGIHLSVYLPGESFDINR
jgi:cyanophycinase